MVGRDSIDVKKALALINIDLESHDPLHAEWVLRSSQAKRKKDNSASSVYSYAMTSVKSKKSRRTDVDQIIQETQDELQRTKKIDDFLEKNKEKDSDDEVLKKYLESVQQHQTVPEPKQMVIRTNNGEKLREKRGSISHINLRNFSDLPMKQNSTHNIASQLRK